MPKSSFEGAPVSAKRGENYLLPFGQDVDSGLEMKEKNSSKPEERSGNVYENKGLLWKTWERSRKVIENKDSYAGKVGMLLKRQVVSINRIGCSECHD